MLSAQDKKVEEILISEEENDKLTIKPLMESSEETPISCPSKLKLLNCIIYPGIINNIERAIDNLGGIDEVSHAFENPEASLSVNLVKSELGPSLAGNKHYERSLFLSVKTKYKVNKKTGEKTCIEVLPAQIVGLVHKTFTFTSMVDFAYFPSKPNFTELWNMNKLFDIDWALEQDVPLVMLPSKLSKFNEPQTDFYDHVNLKKLDMLSKKHRLRPYVRNFTKNNRFEDTDLPPEPLDLLKYCLTVKMFSPDEKRLIDRLFEKRPIWVKPALFHFAKVINKEKMKYLLPTTGYFTTTGPFRRMWVSGAGQEVGRSCIVMEFKGKKIMLDCGIHPGLQGLDALPFVDLIEANEIDLLLITHFHLDHSGALPWFLLKTKFKGKCFMTHATKAIYRWLLSDYIKVSNIGTEQMLYTEADLEKSMDRIETINFHEEKDVGGIRFCAYNAGHVLGAAMFMIEIAGVKVLYTGDFSRQEDRHLMAAEIPPTRPEILITESTYGTHIHEKREERERRFTMLVHDIVNRGGRCLIPVFALGRAQELLLILDEYWGLHPELHDIPIYYASSLAKKCMAVYQTYINAMNDRIKRQIAVNNPFVFKHITNLKSIDHFEDIGPCVIMASPGVMESGLSRELFEMWCTDSKNGVIIAGYVVQGTLAKAILSEPEDITTMSGQKLPLKMSVDYISFSAHTDYQQTREFINILKPPHIVLVHGEQNEMQRLKSALVREYEENAEDIKVYNPRNTVGVDFYFTGEKTAKIMGDIAVEKPAEDNILSGVLLKKNFSYHIFAAEDIPRYSDMLLSEIQQKQLHRFTGSFTVLQNMLSHLTGSVPEIVIPNKKLRVLNSVDVSVDKNFATLEWSTTPENDMYADIVVQVLMKIQAMSHGDMKNVSSVPFTEYDHMHFKECLIEILQEMFGEESVPKIFRGEKLFVAVDGKKANINLKNLEVTCEDEVLQRMVQAAVNRLHNTVTPLSIPNNTV